MLFKMLGIERAWKLKGEGVARPRQVFVTQSRVLAEKVEEYFSKLIDSLATGSLSKEELAKLTKARKEEEELEALVDREDEVNWRSDLPDRFSLLKDEHFPLFITFSKAGVSSGGVVLLVLRLVATALRVARGGQP